MKESAANRNYWELPQPAGGPRTVLSLRSAGDMSLRCGEGRLGFLESLGIAPSRSVALQQVHSRTVFTTGGGKAADIPWPETGGPRKGDGLITGEAEAVLCMTVADCLPIVLYDHGSRAFGLLHSGWKGTGIVLDGIDEMRRRFRSLPADLSVVLGPCIGPCCYRVPEERGRLFRSRFGGAAVRLRGQSVFLDLRQANLDLLADAGVFRVLSEPACTACTPELGSFRREGADGFTRMLVVCGFF